MWVIAPRYSDPYVACSHIGRAQESLAIHKFLQSVQHCFFANVVPLSGESAGRLLLRSNPS
jgi:hypothetical protein